MGDPIKCDFFTFTLATWRKARNVEEPTKESYLSDLLSFKKSAMLMFILDIMTSFAIVKFSA